MSDSRQTSDKFGTDRAEPRPCAIRRASVTDAHAIAEIGVLGWQEAYRGILPDEFLAGLSLASRETAWRTMLESDPDGAAPAWVAERDGQIVAYLSSGPPRDEDVPPPAAEVYAIYTRPSEWRTGAGSALMRTAEAHWRGHGAATLVLWVLEVNAPARAFYQAMGWRPDEGRQMLEIGGAEVIEVRYRLRTAR